MVARLTACAGISETLRVNGNAHLTRDPDLLETCAVEGRTPWFATDVEIRQVFSHCGKAFLRTESWPDPDDVRSPSQSIAALAAEERRRESHVRREVEDAYRPELYGHDEAE